MISIKKIFVYIKELIAATIMGTKQFIIKFKDGLIQNFIGLAIIILISYIGSIGVLQNNQINSILSPLGKLADIIITIVFIPIFYFVIRLIFYSPIELFYKYKSIAEHRNWKDVEVKLINPKGYNQLGWGLEIKNNKFTELNNLSAWITDYQEEGKSIKFGEPQRFGYAKQYYIDKLPIYSSFELSAGKNVIFIIGNCRLGQENAIINTKDAQGNGGFAIYPRKEYIIDIELRAMSNSQPLPNKVIRYIINYDMKLLHINEYKAVYK